MALQLMPDPDWKPLWVTEPGVIAYPAPPKNKVQFDEDWSEFAFFFNVFYYMKVSIFAGLLPQIFCQIVLVLALQLVVWYCPLYQLPADVKTMHNGIKNMVAFLLVFKSGQGYGNYIEGRKQLGGFCNNCRELAQYAFTYKLKPDADMVKVEYLRKVMRRKINLLLAFVRQQCRENGEGFAPGCGIEDEEFGVNNWYKDPVSPPIANLVSAAERDMYSKIGVGMRPATVQTELNMLAHELAHETTSPAIMYYGFMKNSEDTMNLFKGALRIVTTPVPLPYVHMLYFLCFVYCYLTPFIYVKGERQDGWADYKNMSFGFLSAYAWAPSILYVMGFYGIMEVAAKLHNPFGHDDIDHDMGEFNVKAHKETLVIATLAVSETGSDLTDYTKVSESAQSKVVPKKKKSHGAGAVGGGFGGGGM